MSAPKRNVPGNRNQVIYIFLILLSIPAGRLLHVGADSLLTQLGITSWLIEALVILLGILVLWYLFYLLYQLLRKLVARKR